MDTLPLPGKVIDGVKGERARLVRRPSLDVLQRSGAGPVRSEGSSDSSVRFVLAIINGLGSMVRDVLVNYSSELRTVRGS